MRGIFLDIFEQNSFYLRSQIGSLLLFVYENGQLTRDASRATCTTKIAF